MTGRECWCDYKNHFGNCKNTRPYEKNESVCFGCEVYKKHLIEQEDIQCSGCGFKGPFDKWYNSSVHKDFQICPTCGAVRFVCEDNRRYRKPKPEYVAPPIFG